MAIASAAGSIMRSTRSRSPRRACSNVEIDVDQIEFAGERDLLVAFAGQGHAEELAEACDPLLGLLRIVAHEGGDLVVLR